MKEFEVYIQIRNNRLKERREVLGLSTYELAERAGISYGSYIRLENMKGSPLGYERGFGPDRKFGVWTPAARKLATFHGVEVEELFPGAVLAMKKSEAKRKMGEEEIIRLLPSGERECFPSPSEEYDSVEMREAVRTAISRLSAREADILSRVFGLFGNDVQSHAEIAKEYGVTASRIGMITNHALRVVRHPSTSREVRELVIHEDN